LVSLLLLFAVSIGPTLQHTLHTTTYTCCETRRGVQ